VVVTLINSNKNFRAAFILLSCVISFTLQANTLMENKHSSKNTKTIKVATFNVSMESLNYRQSKKDKIIGNELFIALKNGHQQIKNIAEIIQRVNPDVILLNEFDRQNESHLSLKLFLERYLAVSQNNQNKVHYPYFYQGPVNTGVKTPFDLNNNNVKGETPADAYGFGYFEGHFAMAVLSKFPIDVPNIRTFQKFKWQDMPNALRPVIPETQEYWYKDNVWSQLRLSSKSHWDIPIIADEHTIHLLASHPTPPVFDGPENRNGNRNHDEIRFWHDYITPNKSAYIYDDKNRPGGLKGNQSFIILGDLNASVDDGDANTGGIGSLLTSPLVLDTKPSSEAAALHSPEKTKAKYHTAYWRMRADYVLASSKHFGLINSGVFWPTKNQETFRLIKDRQASSDHRLVWAELAIHE
jgi:endonuclease/exonuclease/phosphatase family metal-dependent hydrolase